MTASTDYIRTATDKTWGWSNPALTIEEVPYLISIPNIPIGRTLDIHLVWGAVNSAARTLNVSLGAQTLYTASLGTVGTATHSVNIQIARTGPTTLSTSASWIINTTQANWTTPTTGTYAENTPLSIEFSAASSSNRGYLYHANMALL